MRVLLIGDYSAVHYNLYSGLLECGIDVTLVSSGDGSKQIPTQHAWTAEMAGRWSRLAGTNGKHFCDNNRQLINGLIGYDVVQIINPIMSEDASIASNISLFNFLKKNNSKLFLYSCGDDLNWISKCYMTKHRKYWFSDPSFYVSREAALPAKYLLNPLVRKLCNSVYEGVDGIIPGSADYDWALGDKPNRRKIVPFPVDCDSLPFRQVTRRAQFKIVHGKQNAKAIRKGDRYFHRAGESLGTDFEYNVVGGVPYLEYLGLLREGDIFFDQVHSYDQGMNALLAMASGMVVFSGFEKEFYSNYPNISSPVGINARPNVEYISQQLQKVATGAIDVEEISSNARRFVETYHARQKVSELFLKEWVK